jgi:general secretion pathway protein G
LKTRTVQTCHGTSTCTSETERACAAFTLFELLAVISIVSILAAILIPITAKVRSSARASSCVSNLRQIGAAFHLYAQEHQQKFPAPQDSNDDYWFWVLQPYVSSPVDDDFTNYNQLNPIFTCPEWDRHRNEWGMDVPDIGFSMSAALTGTFSSDRQTMIDQIDEPSRTVLVLENYSTNTPYFPFSSGQTVADIVPLFFETPQNVPQGVGRHEHRANYLFADGHVKGSTVEEGKRMFESN